MLLRMEPTNYIWTETIPGIVFGSVRNNRIRWKRELFSWMPSFIGSDRSEPQKIRLQFSAAFERGERWNSRLSSLVSHPYSLCGHAGQSVGTRIRYFEIKENPAQEDTFGRRWWTDERDRSNCPNW